MPSVKEQVLLLLKEKQGSFVSGQALAQQLQVTRAAVWKAIQALTRDGHAIEATPRLGYRLLQFRDTLNQAEILRALQEKKEAADVFCFASIDSTNTEARRRADGLRRAAVFAANAQTAGRGRQGHTFYSPEDTGLYLTVFCPLDLPLQDAALATQAMAVAAMRAVREAGGPRLQVKWVNDLFYQGHKVAGILTEALSDLETGRTNALICGIGLNLTTQLFPDELTQAGSIGPLDRSRLAGLIAAHFLALARKLPDTVGWLGEYREHSLVLGKGLTFQQNGQTVHAVAERIDERGGLVVRLADSSLRTLTSGEISIHPDSLR